MESGGFQNGIRRFFIFFSLSIESTHPESSGTTSHPIADRAKTAKGSPSVFPALLEIRIKRSTEEDLYFGFASRRERAIGLPPLRIAPDEVPDVTSNTPTCPVPISPIW
nr:hypothetical protein [Methylacidimicrobium tartarophylax]